MANLQVKDFSDAKYERLKRIAAARGRTIRDVVILAIDRELDWVDFNDALDRQEPTTLPISAAEALHEARAEHELAP